MCKEKQYGGSLHFYDDLQIIEHEDEPLNRAERLKAVEKPLLAWYHSRAKSMDIRDHAPADQSRGCKALF